MVRPHSRQTGYALPDIFDEVEEDLRAERARSMARRFGWLAAAAVVAVLAGTGAYVWWSQQQKAASDATADRFIAATQQADKAAQSLAGLDRAAASQAEATFADIAAHGPAGYQVLARLHQAGLQWQLGQTQQAVATWKSVADNTAAPQLLRDLASVTSAEHVIDTGNPVLLKQSMEALTAAENPWRPMAEQVIALIDIRQGKPRDAAEVMKRLMGDPQAPEGIRQMAADLITTLPPEALAPAPQTTKPPIPRQAAAPAKPGPHG
jgi:hypothetical protein